MKTCKDCVHSDVCHIVETSSWWELTDYRCNDFKDKSKFIELPCSIGETVYMITYGHDDWTGHDFKMVI